MEWLVNNWFIIVGIVCLLIFIACNITVNNIKKFLRYAVSYAESALGSGTGQLKLLAAYQMALERFPILKIIPFSFFSKWVDIALDWMRDQLDKNVNIKNLVDNGGLV